MNPNQLKKVMKKYKTAWERQDSDLILECFTENGIYQESPLSKPYKGHKEIKKFWEKIVVNETNNIKFKSRKYYISKDGKTGFVEWECKNNYKNKKSFMTGIMILKMKGDKITYLNEYWNTKIYK